VAEKMEREAVESRSGVEVESCCCMTSASCG